MCSRKIVSVAIFTIVSLASVECALRKSWKSPANFEAEIPKFTPFESEEVASGGGGDSGDSIDKIKTTEVVTEPAPSAETLANKISSRIKMPEKYVADIYSTLTKEAAKNAQDFGRFAYQVPPTSSEEEEKEEENAIPNSKLLLNQRHSGEEEIDDFNEDEEEDDEVEVVASENETHYKIGHLLNVTVDSDDNTVNVNVDQDTLRGIFSGRAGNKKHGMLERVVPLFIIPFLIQSAIVPFMVTSIKLFLMKSLFAGKIAILFFLLGALKNHQNSVYMKSFAAQNQPFLTKDYSGAFIPERRIETGFDGYKVDGKPESFIN